MGEPLLSDDRQLLVKSGLHLLVDPAVAPQCPLPGTTAQFPEGILFGHAAKGGKDGLGKVPVRLALIGDPGGVLQGLGAMGEMIDDFFRRQEKIDVDRGLSRLQAREFGIEGDGPEHAV